MKTMYAPVEDFGTPDEGFFRGGVPPFIAGRLKGGRLPSRTIGHSGSPFQWSVCPQSPQVDLDLSIGLDLPEEAPFDRLFEKWPEGRTWVDLPPAEVVLEVVVTEEDFEERPDPL